MKKLTSRSFSIGKRRRIALLSSVLIVVLSLMGIGGYQLTKNISGANAAGGSNYTISVNVGSGSGTVSGGGTVAEGDDAMIRATASDGWTFSHWSCNGTVYTSRVWTFSDVRKDYVCSAYFTKNPTSSPDYYTISVHVGSGSGTVDGGGRVTVVEGSTLGQEVTISATASDGWTFSKWICNGSITYTSREHTFADINKDYTCHAYFTQVQVFNVTTAIYTGQDSMGTVSGGGSVNAGKSMTITATPRENYTFDYWDCNGEEIQSPNVTLTVNHDYTCYAHFKRSSHTITTSISTIGGTNGGTASADQSTVSHGGEMRFTASPKPGYVFDHWLCNNSESHSTAEITISNITRDYSCVAYFKKDTSTTDPNSGSNTDPNSGSNTDPNSGSNTDPNSGSNTDPNSGSNTDPNSGNNDNPGEDNPGGNNDNPGENEPNNDNPGENESGNNDNPGEDNPGGNNDNPGSDEPGNNDNPGESETPSDTDNPKNDGDVNVPDTGANTKHGDNVLMISGLILPVVLILGYVGRYTKFGKKHIDFDNK